MKTKLIIGLFILLCASSYIFSTAQAGKNTAATHMWIRTGNALVHVYINSLEQCEMLTKQAASINSSEANCYSGSKLLKKMDCSKSPHRDASANCS